MAMIEEIEQLTRTIQYKDILLSELMQVLYCSVDLIAIFTDYSKDSVDQMDAFARLRKAIEESRWNDLLPKR